MPAVKAGDMEDTAMTDYVKNLAARASQKLADKEAEHEQPRRDSQAYVELMLEQHPKLKLPQLMSLEETTQLIEERRVTKSMLADALSKVRAEKKLQRAQEPIALPKQPRKRRAVTSVPADRSTTAKDEGFSLPLGQSSSGRVANGSIEEL